MAGKALGQILDAWKWAQGHPGKRVAVISTKGTMMLEFKPDTEEKRGFKVKRTHTDEWFRIRYLNGPFPKRDPDR